MTKFIYYGNNDFDIIPPPRPFLSPGSLPANAAITVPHRGSILRCSMVR